jgi:non-ribosomal peptide synthetase-like protein
MVILENELQEQARALATKAPVAPQTLVEIFAQTATRHGEKVALAAADATLTYSELARGAAELSDRLRELGVGPGERVGVRLQSGTAELYVAILGVLLAGAAYVPVDADEPPARAESIWELAGVCAVLEEGLALRCLTAGVSERRQTGPDDEAWVIFTSGSTGQPKGVAVSHRSAAAFVAAEARLWTVRPADRVLAGLSVAFDASCEEMWMAWSSGAALVPAARALVRSGADLGPWLQQQEITVISTVPTLAAMWEEAHLAKVRLMILGGEACPAELGWRLARRREVWNTYGPTEATVVTTAARIVPGEPVTIGWPLSGWDVAVVDKTGQPVSFGEEGELVIGGVGLARYLDAVLDLERFAPLPALGWDRAYRSGDIVRERIDGFEFVGRSDQQVKLGGRRLELGEVEAHLAAAGGVRAAAAKMQTTLSGNKVLVGYVVGDVDADHVRAQVAEQLPDGLAPLVVVLEEMPISTAGKIDRKALPWPPPGAPGRPGGQLDGAAAWLAERFAEQLGPVPIDTHTDFFAAGGNSLAAAKLVSALRERYPSLAVSDVYKTPRLGDLAALLQELGRPQAATESCTPTPPVRWGIVQLLGLAALCVIQASQWVIGGFAYGNVVGGGLPQLGWGWLVAGWLVLATPMGRTAIVLAARRLLLGDLRPGRYSRHSWLACRVWFLERLTEVCGIGRLAGTPWAGRYARLIGASVGRGARLGTVPHPGALVRIGARATLEGDVDMHGWWIDGQELVVGEVSIGAGARIGTRVMLMPGAVVENGAEVEPGSVVTGTVPAGERWGGSPARYEGPAGEGWPAERSPGNPRRRLWRAAYPLGLALASAIPVVAFMPGIVLVSLVGSNMPTLHGQLLASVFEVVCVASMFVLTYALLVAGVVRLLWRLLRTGTHMDDGAVGWALWLSEDLLANARVVLFPLYSSLYTRPWLRLMGLKIGRRTEISTAVGLNKLVSFGELSFAADDVVLSAARARDGWLQIEEIEVGDRSFLGNGAILKQGTRIGERSIVGVLTVAPPRPADGTCWLGSPALELPRVPDVLDPARTTDPPLRRVLARAGMDLLRIFGPTSASVLLGWLAFLAVSDLGVALGVVAEIALAPLVLLATGVLAASITVILKWVLIGRYRPGEHPLWSFFVWRDELINSAQEQLAGAWLMGIAMGTPLICAYLRALGAKVGRGVWCETLAVTEFDLVRLEDGSVINRQACVETHLFHDRLMRLGPASLAAGSTLGPASAVLPDTSVGAGTCVGGRSVVMRGESLPAGTRWHGAPVVRV